MTSLAKKKTVSPDFKVEARAGGEVGSEDSTSLPCIRSMTGQGMGRSESELGAITVELRSVNQRGLKITPRLSDALLPLEPRLEQWVRSRIQRGTVHANASFSPAVGMAVGEINVAAVTAYAIQLRRVQESIGGDFAIDLTGLLQLPGSVVSGSARSWDTEQLWLLLVDATDQAIAGLDKMRLAEGEAMASQLRLDSAAIQENLTSIAELSPRVVESYRQRLEGKIRRVMDEHGLEFAASDLLRDIQLFADRSDISEEVTRLNSHLNMFSETLGSGDASGRKLDFIVQEMFRETNTIGSKASDSEISARVVDVKCALERMRELVQNIQ